MRHDVKMIIADIPKAEITIHPIVITMYIFTLYRPNLGLCILLIVQNLWLVRSRSFIIMGLKNIRSYKQ